MSNDTKNEIIKALYGAEKKASKLKSIEEKRQHYRNYLSRVLPVLDIDESVDPNSEEINQLIDDNFISITVEKPQIFEDTGYIPWLDDARNNIDWKFYDRYEKYLLEYKHWKPKDINTIKTTSDIILDHMANPKSDKYFHKKGLVIGDIQSGKTTNYTAVINKAIDAGYKIVIVFAGLTKDLRNQTQMRIDSEVLGYKTKMNSKGDTTGVGLIRQLNVEGLTCSDDKKDFGDMKKTFSTHTLDKDLNPIVAIVKKNKSILQHLNKFLTSSQSNCYTNGKLDIPVLIIDDEVDQASVDTKDSDSIENASAINKQIRTILDNLNRYSYVGYTATPFANVFIDPDKGIEGEGEDIYPKDFILCIPSNDDYWGIKEYFGVDATSNDDNTNDHMSDLFVKIDDYNVLFSHKDRIDASTSTDVLNNSLKDAIKSFIIASSIKKARGFDEHNSMLIHIARFKNPSTTLRPLVSKYVGELYHYLKYEQTKAMLEFKNAWENSFETVSKKRLGSAFNDEWNKIK